MDTRFTGTRQGTGVKGHRCGRINGSSRDLTASGTLESALDEPTARVNSRSGLY